MAGADCDASTRAAAGAYPQAVRAVQSRPHLDGDQAAMTTQIDLSNEIAGLECLRIDPWC
jgi:hypothetical protein